jgi:hypothetical protein
VALGLGALVCLTPLFHGKIQAILIFPVFLLLLAIKPYLPALRGTPLAFRYIAIGIASGMLTEWLVFMAHFQVFREHLGVNLLVAIGIYAPLVVIWFRLLLRYRFSLLEVFLVSAVWGVIFEQNGAVLLSGNPLGWLYVALIDGAWMSIPFLFCRDELDQLPRTSSRKKYFIALGFLTLAYPIAFLWMSAWKLLGV